MSWFKNKKGVEYLEDKPVVNEKRIMEEGNLLIAIIVTVLLFAVAFIIIFGIGFETM
jgi:hypothetical protein